MEIDKDLLLKIIEKFGYSSQVNKLREELLELALALNQINCPTKDSDEMEARLYNELADVKIMMAQAELLFDPIRINSIVELKLNLIKEKYLLNT